MAAVMLAGAWPARAQLAFQVIVHPDNSLGVLTSQEISNLFLKRRGQWGSGLAVEPVDLPAGTEVRDAFSIAIHGRDTTSVKSFWQQQVFSGRAVPPLELGSSSQVLDYVRDHPGAVGYVSATTSLVGVKRLGVLDPPRVAQRREPRYPPAARNTRFGGDVVLSVEVTETGSVAGVSVVKGLGLGLSDAAVAAARQWRYEPGTLDGVPVAQTIEVTIRFTP